MKYEKDEELTAYRKLIGNKQYKKEYDVLYNQIRQKKGRFSGNEEPNSTERLEEIKKLYANGVPNYAVKELAGKIIDEIFS